MREVRRVFHGFTLIELLIVVAIIAILAAIAVPNFLEAQVRAKASRVKSDLRTIITALESYAVDNNKYPVPQFYPIGSDGYQTLDAITHSGAQFVCGGLHDSFPLTGTSGIVGGLTSPISYLSSANLKDPFAIGAYDDNHNNLGYQNIDYWVDPGVKYVEFNIGTPLGALQKKDYGSYIVRSIGPDHNYNSVAVPYDPTNGSVSRGDIYRTALRAKNAEAVGSE